MLSCNHRKEEWLIRILQLKDLSKIYYDTGTKDIILHKVNLNFHLGEFVSILGESGVGKTTLMNIIGGLDSDYKGQIIFNDQSLSNFSSKQLDQYRRKDIGFIFQSFHLINHLTVAGNIEVALDMTNMNKSDKKRRVTHLLQEVGLTDQAKKYPDQLSGGQQQRVSIARALASDPKILIADEPTGALDQKNTTDILQILDHIAQSGKLVLTVTHSQRVANYGTRIVRIVDGRIDDDYQLKPSYKVSSSENKVESKPLPRRSLWKMAFSDFKQHKLQNILIAFGSAIGLFSILAILGLGTGVRGYVHHQITSQISPNTVIVEHHSQTDTKPFSSNDIQRIHHVKGVKSVDKGYSIQGGLYSYNKKKLKITRMATGAQLLKPKDIIYGHYPKGNGVIISNKDAKKIDSNKRSLLGKKINVTASINPMPAQGMMQSTPTPKQKGSMKIVGVYKGSKGRIITNYNTINDFATQNNMHIKPQYLTANLKGNVKQVNKIQNHISNIRDKGKKSYSVLGATGSLLKLVDRYVNIIVVILSSIAGIALLVTAVLMIAILLISVNERKQEIGILRAIGASKRNIRGLFESQSVLMSFASSICATVIGCLAEFIINYYTTKGIDYGFLQISFINVIIVFLISLLIYLIASVIPAWKASRLDPVECLK